jgi:hypothetical protein
MLNTDGTLDTERVEHLMSATDSLGQYTYELELYKKLNAALPFRPLSARGPVHDFYTLYGIE